MLTTNVNTSHGGQMVFSNTFVCTMPHAPAWISNVNTAMPAHEVQGAHLDVEEDIEGHNI